MSAVLPLLPQIQKDILETFAHCGLGQPCGCGALNAIFRCVECFNAPLWCRSCVIREHRYTPFHHIEKWNGRMFIRSRLGSHTQGEDDSAEELLVLQTDRWHRGRPCVNAHSTKPMIRAFTIADYNGFHNIKIQFCECASAHTHTALWRELVAVRLFPATFIQPKTAFTFNVLKQFHIHSLTSKKSAYDYVKALTKLTDNSQPQSITDRYREFLFAHRIWRYLALQRRTGQAHGIDAFVPHRREGSLTLRCPACPEVGFNISEATMKEALETDCHKFTLFVSVDGNFKMQRKNKRDDPNDFALNDGNGYFVETEEYKRYLKVAKPVEEAGTCPHLQAARMQNMAKFKNAVVTGVIAVQCARHGFYLPQGMVDLSKGEAFANTDYALCYALGEATPLRWIVATYDIWCHYGVKLAARVEEMFPSMAPIIAAIRGAIPKMHIHNHIERCQLEWNLNWLCYVAFTVGEMIETGWAEHNLTAGSTKEMNAGHRHDAVDDTSNHWNWDKMIALASADTLLRLYRLAISERRTRTANFEDVDSDVREKRPVAVAKWEAMDVKPRMEKGKFYSVFQATFKNGPPTHAAAYEKLLRAEVEKDEAVKGSRTERSVCDLPLVMAYLRAGHREHVKRMVTMSSAPDLIRAARTRLFRDVTALRGRQVARVPELAQKMSEVDFDKPEGSPLLLPSHFVPTTRADFGLEALATIEYDLRLGQAHDALNDLRTAIRTFNYNLQIKKTDIHGVGATTRAQNFLKTLSNDIQIAGDTYRRARAAMIQLGLPVDDPVLRPLDRKEQHGKGGKAQRTGDSRTVEPWFWRVGRPAGLSAVEEEEWEIESKLWP
ncbi:hypothetical protein B0H11DRAFT_1727305 [Mycena galericulata]|nr:hypothetical protein B0H11DRAFT_1727305 [Mycena galericulata]